MKHLALIVIIMCGVVGCSKSEGMKSTMKSDTELGISSEVRPAERKVGGQCEYTSYTGTATITRVDKTDASRAQASTMGGPGYEGNEVWYTYKTDQEVKEEWARGHSQKEHLLLLANSWYPGPHYSEKYGITPGKSYGCVLKVITRGTCTPLIFEFTGIDRSDYFEKAQ